MRGGGCFTCQWDETGTVVRGKVSCPGFRGAGVLSWEGGSMSWEGSGEVGYPPHLLAPGGVGYGRENSTPLGGGRKWCVRGQPGVKVQKRHWGNGLFRMIDPEFPELRGGAHPGVGCLRVCGRLSFCSVKKAPAPRLSSFWSSVVVTSCGHLLMK